MKLRTVIFITALIFHQSCSKTSKPEQILVSAGENRAELEKVLTHYKKLGNDKKLKAAEFLIAYMEYNKYSYEGEIIAHYICTLNSPQFQLSTNKRKI